MKEDIKNIERVIDYIQLESPIIQGIGNAIYTDSLKKLLKRYKEKEEELEKYKTLVDKYGGVEQLEKYILEISKVLGDVSIDVIKTVIQDKDKKLEYLKSKLKKYKKVAEKLAEVVDFDKMDFNCTSLCAKEDCIKECALEWAKEEVEKED